MQSYCCYSSWYIWLPLGFMGWIQIVVATGTYSCHSALKDWFKIVVKLKTNYLVAKINKYIASWKIIFPNCENFENQHKWSREAAASKNSPLKTLYYIMFRKNKLTSNTINTQWKRSRGSSVSIVSGCGLDDRAIEVRSKAGAKDFSSSLCIQTGAGVQPASCPMGTGGPFPGGKARSGRDADHSPPSSAEVYNE
jgi:hypothetical protein